MDGGRLNSRSQQAGGGCQDYVANNPISADLNASPIACR